MSSSTNFYTQLHEAAPNVDVSLRIKEKNGRYTVMFQPETANNNTLRGLNVTGTPAELDAGFFEKVLEAMQANQGLVTTVEPSKASDQAKKSDPPAYAKSSAKGKDRKKEKGNKGKGAAAGKGKDKRAKAAPAGPIVGDIFSQAPSTEEETPTGSGHSSEDLPELEERAELPEEQDSDNNDDTAETE